MAINATGVATSKKRLPIIESHRPQVQNSASFDLEWIPFKGRHNRSKTKIFAACFCTSWGERIILHISRYSDSSNPEKDLIQDILFYQSQFPLTFGWYTTGVAIYDDKTGLRTKGHDSDLFILYQRCMHHGLSSPIEFVKYSKTPYLKNKTKKHFDLNKVFDKTLIQDGVFNAKYRTTDLHTVSLALLGIGKYDNFNAGMMDVAS